MRRILIACGGTGGHVFPGWALGETLLRRGYEVKLLLCGKDVEANIAARCPLPRCTIQVRPISLRSPGSAWALFTDARALLRALGLLRQAGVVVGMGGYGSAPALLAAVMLRRRLVLHEANAVPGRVTELFARRAHAIGLGFPECRPYLERSIRSGVPLVDTGVPIRRNLVEAAAQGAGRPGSPLILVFGGSRGARALDELAAGALPQLGRMGVDFSVEHVCGSGRREQVAAAYRHAGLKARVHQFTLGMEELYRDASVALARAGASTCAELCLFGIPALLIPYPHAVRDHQWRNAAVLAEQGAAVVCSQQQATAGLVAETLHRILGDAERQRKMAAAARSRARPQAAEAMADLVETVLPGTGNNSK